MSFSYNKFLMPLTTTDTNVKILDDSGVIKFSINPFSVVNVMVSNNLLKVSSKGGKVITISFSTTNEAKLALEKIQVQLDNLKEKTPNLIDKQIKNYVDNVTGASGTSGTSGSAGTSGISGTSGSAGTSGTSGTSGSAGTSGTSDSYSATSSTTIVVPSSGYVVNFDTQYSLAYTPGQTVLMYSELPNLYVIDDYIEEYGTIIGEIDSYDKITGSMSIVVDYSQSIGNTYSYWYINLTGTLFDTSAGVTGPAGATGPAGSPSTTDLSLSGTLTVSGTASFNGLTLLEEVSEVINPIGATNSTIVYDFTGGNIWYHGTASNDYTANFINLSTENNRAITTTIILPQGPTAYIPTIVQIDGITQSVKWSGGASASGSPDKVDIIGFTFIRTESSWSQVLGNINSFS